MSWNYRIVRTVGEPGSEGPGDILYGLYEVYYDDEDRPVARTEDPESFGGYDTPEELVNSLVMALGDASGRPVLDDLPEWPGFGKEEE